MPDLTTSADIDAFLASANDAAARTELGLTTLATTTPGTGVATALGVNIGSAGSFVVNGGALGSPSSAGTLPAFTLGGTIAGGGNQLNNIVIGTSTPLAGTFTTLVAGSATSLLVGTAGSAVGSVGFRNATSGTATLAPPTGALGTYQVTLPNAASTLPIFGQQVTFTGPTAARSYALPDANATLARTDAANTFTGVQSMTSPAFTTSITTPSTTVGLFDSTATTVNAFGATTTLNIGASAATVLNFGGFTSAAELRFLEPSGSGTNYSGLKQPALAASITYLLPSDAPANGDVLTSQSNGTLSWEAPSGSANAVTAASAAGSSGLFWVSGGADRTATATDTVSTANITTANVGAIVASGATIALLNTVATTVNAFGATTALNVGASAALVMNFGGHTSAAEMRFLEPSGSGTNYIGFKAVAMAASTTYTWPATAATAGQVLTAGATPTALEWTTPAGGGTVTVVSSGSLTSTALVTGGGTTTLQTPSATSTLDSSGNIALAGTATATRFIPSGSTVPTNGLYLPAANTLGWAVNSAAEMQLTATALSPAVDGGNSLGTTALGWQNLFGNTGFVLNIENSDWVATHTTGIVTVGTGDLRVTTAGTNAASVVTIGGTQTLTNKTLTSPTMTAPALGTVASGNLDACTADGTNKVGYRNVPQNAKTGSYTLVATDVGKVVPNTTGGWTVNNSVHSAGDVISLYNDSGSSQNITAGTITTMRLAGSATTGTRALAARGLATLYFQTASEVVVSGAGVT